MADDMQVHRGIVSIMPKWVEAHLWPTSRIDGVVLKRRRDVLRRRVLSMINFEVRLDIATLFDTPEKSHVLCAGTAKQYSVFIA